MVKWTFAFRSLLTLVVSACIALVCMGASVRGGAFGDATPAAIIPASADVYVEINRGGAQGTTLTQLWQAYQSHPGTAAALAPLRSAMGQGSLMQAQSLLAQWAARAAVALWLPPGPGVQPQVAIVAQLKPSSYMNGSNPLAGLATLTPDTTYQGTTIFHVAFKDGTSGYGCVVSGDGVLTPDVATIERVIDTATFHAPALLTNADFAATTAQLPLERALTVYASAHAFARAPLPSTAPLQPAQTQAALLKHPYALAMVAAPTGVEFVTSVLPVGGLSISPTPNEGAGIVGANAVLYASVDNVAGTLLAPGVLPATSLAQLQQQTGIDVRHDLLSWMTGETVVDVNTDVSPAVGAILLAAQPGNGNNGSGFFLSGLGPKLPGSLELAWNVADPAAVQQSLDRVAAALARAAKTSTPLLMTTTLPDGTVAHMVAGLPSLGYAFRGHWLILSSSLSNDLAAAATPLSADPAYTAALASVPGVGPLVSVSYIDVSRLLRVADKWVAYTSKMGSSSKGARPGRMAPAMRRSLKTLALPIHDITAVAHQAGAYGRQVAGDLRATRLSASLVATPMTRKLLSAAGDAWQQIEPLIAPVRTIVSTTRQVGASGEQVYIFITIKP